MKQRRLGAEGPDVSVVGYGGMPLSIQGRPDEEQAIRVIHAALDSGMTLIDTADVYCLDHEDIGHNERLVAKALAAWPGDSDRIVVATKGGLERPDGSWTRNGRPEHLRAAADASLTALGVERIDLYQLHAPDPDVPFEESVGAIAELRQAGKIDRAGLSNVSVEQIRAAEAIVPVASVQNRLSPFFREAVDGGVVEYCGENGIAFLAYSPVGGGRLNKKLPDHPAATAVAHRHGVSAHGAVLAWVSAQGPSVFIIPGARSVEHVLDSAEVADITLSADDLLEIDSAEFSTA